MPNASLEPPDPASRSAPTAQPRPLEPPDPASRSAPAAQPPPWSPPAADATPAAILARAQTAFTADFVPAHAGRLRVVATDVDGTLTGPDGLLHPAGLQALHRLRRRPDPPALILVTGRPAAAVQGLLLYTGFVDSPIIAENGAVIVARPGAAPQLQAPFEPAHRRAVQQYLVRAGLDLWPGPDHADRHVDLTFVPPTDAPPRPADLAQLAERIATALRATPPELDLPPLRVLHSTVHVHVGPAGIDKAEALRRLLAGEAAGLPDPPLDPATCVCLGDGENDAALFTAYPDRAIAVPQPGPVLDPALAACARYAAPAVADEGFAAVLDALFPDS